MIKKILVGGTITLIGAFVGALVEQMAHDWDSMADDYNDLLRKADLRFERYFKD